MDDLVNQVFKEKLYPYNQRTSFIRTRYRYILNARDKWREPATYGQKPPAATIPTDPNNTGDLPQHTIKLAIGSPVMLRSNLKDNEGLINGNMSIVCEFQWPAFRNDQLEDGELPKKIFVQFDDSTKGNGLKESNGYVGISPINIVFKIIKDMEMWKEQCFQLF